MPYVLFDVAVLLILAVFVLRGASRGFILSFFGLVAVVIAFVGATFVADTLAPRVATALEPKFATAIEARLEEEIKSTALPDPETGAMAGVTPAELPLQDVLDVLRDMGFYEELIDSIDKAVQDGMLTVAASAAAAVAAAIAQSVAYLVLFLVAFVAILILWALLSHGLNLVARLPGLHFLNKTGGALVGLLKGVLLLFVAAWLLRYFGNLIPEEAVSHTKLLHFFMTTNPLTLFIGK